MGLSRFGVAMQLIFLVPLFLVGTGSCARARSGPNYYALAINRRKQHKNEIVSKKLLRGRRPNPISLQTSSRSFTLIVLVNHWNIRLGTDALRLSSIIACIMHRPVAHLILPGLGSDVVDACNSFSMTYVLASCRNKLCDFSDTQFQCIERNQTCRLGLQNESMNYHCRPKPRISKQMYVYILGVHGVVTHSLWREFLGVGIATSLRQLYRLIFSKNCRKIAVRHTPRSRSEIACPTKRMPYKAHSNFSK